jgi:beta-galactosidase/beta-glucuronidase
MFAFSRFSLLLWALLLSCVAGAAAPYQALAPPLDTPFTEQARTNPWPEYPRPQLRRDVWQSLNGIWTYQAAQGPGDAPGDVGSPPALPLAQEVLIPSCIESGISGIMTMGVTHMWFGTNFTVPSNWANGRRVLLNFEAVDYEATVFVNGAKVGFNRGGYSRFTFDITANLVEGNNKLWDPSYSRQVVTRV